MTYHVYSCWTPAAGRAGAGDRVRGGVDDDGPERACEAARRVR